MRIITILALAFAAGCASPETSSVPRSPNIIIFLLDDTGYADFGAYGSEVRTPNIDRLAKNGVQFSNYHTCATCSPTRSMLLTGVDNHLTGMGNMIEGHATSVL